MTNHGEQLHNDIRLIQEVAKHPNLYDHRCKDNKDSKSRDVSWNKIGKHLKIAPDVCKNRWKNLRDKYTREKKLFMTEGEESYKYHCWPLLEEMSFLWNFVSHRKSSAKPGVDSALDFTTKSGFYRAVLPKLNKSIQEYKEEDQATEQWGSLSMQFTHHEDSNSETEPNFLDPACVLVEEDGHIKTQEVDDEDETQPRSKLRRLLQIKEEENSEHSHHENLTDSNYHSDSVQSMKTSQFQRLDEEDYFCMSVAGALRRLPKQKSSLLKIKIMELLHEAQFGSNNISPS